MSSLIIYQVDSFTARPFSGNPAGVCIPEEPLDAGLMQDLSLEMNLSETAFLRRAGDAFKLRWFTPYREVDLCGHATLASAHILWETGMLAAGERAVFETRSGRLEARSDGTLIHMDFPAEPAEIVDAIPDALRRGIGTRIVEVGKNRMDFLVVLDTEQDVRRLEPDMSLLAGLDSRGVIVTAPSNSKHYDFVSRFFAPRFGIPEDPVTGSAHCCLAPFWCDRLGRERLTGYQASGRGGTVEVCYTGGSRVELAGRAVTTARVEILTLPETASAK